VSAYHDGRDLSGVQVATTTVAVIGSGAGGAVAALTLTEAGVDVTLVEEGGYWHGGQMNGSSLHCFLTLYRDHGLTGVNGKPFIPVPVGCAVGGTTVVNSATCFRAPDFVLDEWEAEAGLSRPEMEAAYEWVEDLLHIKPVADKIYGPQAQRFEEACKRLGWEGRRIARNENHCAGTGVCALGCPRDAKMGMHVSAIPLALQQGATLWSGCRADGIKKRGKGYEVVCRAAGGGLLKLRCDKVVVAAGALHTPVLLQRSGLGNRRVGKNLRIHPAVRVMALFEEILNGWREVPQSYNVDQFLHDRIFIQGQFVPPAVQAPALPGAGKAHRAIMDEFDKLASFGALLSERGTGQVKHLGRKPLPLYQLGREDTATLQFGVARTAEAFFEAGARQVFTGCAEQPILHTRSELATFEKESFHPSRFELMGFHPMGTAAVGKDQDVAAADAEGMLFGENGIMVGDASALPDTPHINPQLSLMAMARRNSGMLAAALS